MENIILTGTITSTSNRSTKFEATNKIAYVTLASTEDYKKALDFGLTIYESEDKTRFVIVKLPKKLSLYIGNRQYKYNTGIEDANFSTTNNVGLNLIKGISDKNNAPYIRLTALNLNSIDDLQEVKQLNPFTGEEAEIIEEANRVEF